MNRMKWLVVMCVCFGLAAGSYLAGCGDDDGLSCEEAVEKFLSDDCQADIIDTAAAALDACLDDCLVRDEVCVEDCLDDWEVPGACADPGDKLFSEDGGCDACYLTCGEAFFNCLDDGDDSAAECLGDLELCTMVCAGEMPM